MKRLVIMNFKNYTNINVNKKENNNIKEKNIPSKINEIG